MIKNFLIKSHDDSSSVEHLKDSIENSSKTKLIYLACESFEQASGLPRISAISVMDFGDPTPKTFSISKEKKKQSIKQKRLSVQKLESLEKELLQCFYRTCKKDDGALWLHYGMTKSTYSFDSIEERAKALGVKGIFSIPPSKQFDLCHINREILSEKVSLMEFVGRHPAMVNESVESSCFKNQTFDEVHKSSEEKAKALLEKIKPLVIKHNSKHRKSFAFTAIAVLLVVFFGFAGKSIAESEIVNSWEKLKKKSLNKDGDSLDSINSITTTIESSEAFLESIDSISKLAVPNQSKLPPTSKNTISKSH